MEIRNRSQGVNFFLDAKEVRPMGLIATESSRSMRPER